ncbi:MAG: NAD-dependent epimerase/dehydratase family protein [Anaerolineae bacterium]
MTVLVTGATGFIGRHLVRALCERGHQVRVLVRTPSRLRVLEGLPVEPIIGDLIQPGVVHKAVSGARWIFNCAGLASDWGPWSAFQASNITGVQELLRAALLDDHLERLIHVSTTDVYGYPNRRGVDEDAPMVDRRLPYNSTKIAGERLVWQAHHDRGLPVTVIRPASVYGPHDPNYVGEFLNLLRSGLVVYIDGGETVAGLGYVENVVDLMLLAAEAPAAVGRAFNASDGSSVTWRQFVEGLSRVTGLTARAISLPHDLAYALGFGMEMLWRVLRMSSRPLLTRQAVENVGTHQDFSIERARRMLGFAPRVSFDEGMERVGRWLRDTGQVPG